MLIVNEGGAASVKKYAVVVMVVITVAFAAFISGFYIGKNYNRTTIEVYTTQATLPATTAGTNNDQASTSAPATQPGLININTAPRRGERLLRV